MCIAFCSFIYFDKPKFIRILVGKMFPQLNLALVTWESHEEKKKKKKYLRMASWLKGNIVNG